MPTYRIVPDRSQVWIEAKSSLHPIHGEGTGLSGSIEAEVVDGRLSLNGTPQIRIELPVEALKSGKAIEDSEMLRRVDARRYPTIRGVVTEVKESSPGLYSMLGDITFHGVTRVVEGEVSISQPDGHGTLAFEGEQIFDIREFGVQPPKILMFKVHPDVKVRVRVVAQQEE
ncbi:MAG: YceI family protein [Acidimicrobiia bacterium]